METAAPEGLLNFKVATFSIVCENKRNLVSHLVSALVVTCPLCPLVRNQLNNCMYNDVTLHFISAYIAGGVVAALAAGMSYLYLGEEYY